MNLAEIPFQDADQIDHRVGAGGGGGERGGIGDVGADELDLAQAAERLQEEGALRLALGPARRP
jgi:hypothetical protein